MTLYLQLDGTDDKLQINSTATLRDLTEFEIDFMIDAREDWHQIFNFGGKIINFNSNTLNIVIHADFQDVFVGGVKVTSGTPFLPIGQRHVMKGVLKSGVNTGTNGVLVFNNTISQFLKGRVYSVKLYKGTSLLSHLDMSTGTVQDQSGNGNHATLTGGTFVDDGTGGGDTGTEGTISYSTKNIVYCTASNNYDFKQQLYSTLSQLHSTKQSINRTATTPYDSKIVMYNLGQSNYDTKNQIYNTSISNFDTLQQLLDSGIVGSVSYLTKQVLSLQSINEYQTKQILFRSDHVDFDMLQQLLSDWNTYKEVIEMVLSITINQTLDLSITTQLSASLAITQNKQMNLNI